jgi:hypothetical protein
MNDRDKEAIARIREKYFVTTSDGKHGICLEFAGVPEKFNLTTANNEFTVFTDEWHEHFADMNQLMDFFDGLFSGTTRIVLKLRGRTVVGHQRQVLRDGKICVMSRTGSLIPLFWLRKTFKTLNYTTAKPAAITPPVIEEVI